MPDSFTPEEFRQLMEPWDETERKIVEERLRTNFSREELEQFSPDEAATMAAALERLIPQDEGIDLVGFMDWATGKPLGRGDRRPGLPAEAELFHQGLRGLDQTSQARYHGHRFTTLPVEERDEVLRAVQEGRAEGDIWQAIPSDYFFQRFYGKALHGYFAHPKAWMRIGFMGAAYPEGYTWLGRAEVKARHERQIGWDRL